MNYRTQLIRFVTFLGGIYFFLEFILPGTVAGVRIDQYHEKISNGFTAIGAAAIGLGLINLLMVHGSKTIFLRKGWIDSVALLLGLALMASITALDWRASMQISDRSNEVLVLREFAKKIETDYVAKTTDVPAVSFRNQKLAEAALNVAVIAENSYQQVTLESGADPKLKLLQVAHDDFVAAIQNTRNAVLALSVDNASAPDFAANAKLAEALGEMANTWREFSNLLYERSKLKGIYNIFYQGLFVSLGAAMFSLLGFYIAVAAYRAFRIRSAESGLMMVAAFLVMLGQIPFGIWIWSEFPDVRMWLLSVPNSAAFRAIKIGAAIAGLVMAFRMWFSIESGSFSERRP